MDLAVPKKPCYAPLRGRLVQSVIPAQILRSFYKAWKETIYIYINRPLMKLLNKAE